MTFGVLYESRAHPRSQGFIDRIPAALVQAERSEGFIDRSYLDMETGLHSWGEPVCPRFLPEELHPNVARTLSLWRNLESVFAFSYAGLHGEALALRAECSYTSRVPGPEAFNFRRSFDSHGNPKALNRVLAKEIVSRNTRAK